MRKNKFTILILTFFCFCLTMTTQAQKKLSADYYAGFWNYTVKDLPDGDMSGVMNFTNVNNALKGYFVNSASKDTTQIDKIVLADTTVTLYFSAQGQDINLTLYPKSDTRMEGSIMGMFAFVAEKKKE